MVVQLGLKLDYEDSKKKPVSKKSKATNKALNFNHLTIPIYLYILKYIYEIPLKNWLVKNAKNIIKFRTLDKLYEDIYNQLGFHILEQRQIIKVGILNAYPDERQAEVYNTWFLPIDERIRIHKEVLERLKNGKKKK